MSDEMIVDFKGAGDFVPAPRGPRTDDVPDGTFRGLVTALDAGVGKDGSPKLVAVITHDGNDDKAVDGKVAIRHFPVTGTMAVKRGGKEVVIPKITMFFEFLAACGKTKEEINAFEGKKFALSKLQKALVGKPCHYVMKTVTKGEYAGSSELKAWESADRWEELKAAGKLRSTPTSAAAISAEDDDGLDAPAEKPTKSAAAAKPATTTKPAATKKPTAAPEDDLDALMGDEAL